MQVTVFLDVTPCRNLVPPYSGGEISFLPKMDGTGSS
jgi:hypothetical protein